MTSLVFYNKVMSKNSEKLVKIVKIEEENFHILRPYQFHSYIIRPKKILLFPEMRVSRKIFNPAAAFFFFFLSILRRNSVFFFSFFCFFDSCFCLFVCCFLKFKMYILIHIRLCGRVTDKKISPGRLMETRLLFFGLTIKLLIKKI